MIKNLDIGNQSHIGRVRKVNEDYFGSFQGEFGYLLVVCDGMGGHKGGEIASRIAVESIRKYFEQLGSTYTPTNELLHAVTEANNSIINTAIIDESLNDMGSTVAIALFKDNKVITANLGDSRIYLVRNREIKQLTIDHSLVQQMVDSNMITTEEAKTHPKRNVITKSLGIAAEAQPDISEPIELIENDIFILCTDGLTNYVDENEIKETATSLPAQEAANRLVDTANDRGGGDNITVQVVKVKSSPSGKEKTSKKWLIISSLFIVLFLLIASIFLIDIINKDTKRIAPGNLDSLKTNPTTDQADNPGIDTSEIQIRNNKPDSLSVDQ